MEITHRRILKIAFPIVLANSTVPLLGAVDTFVVGQIASPIPIGAVAIGSLVISVFYWFFGFLRMGTTGLTSQAVGAGDHDEVAALLTRVLFAGFLAGAGILIFQWALFYGAVVLSPASVEVEELALEYLGIRILTAPAAIALFGLNGWLIAQERTKDVLYLQLLMNGLNAGLDLLFVLSLGWGVQGVAIATALAEITGLFYGLFICRKTLLSAAARAWGVVFDRVKLKRMFVVNGDIMLRTMMLEVIFVSFTFIAARFGDVPLAANQVLLQFLMITSYALDGFAFAVEALVGQAFGAKDRPALRKSAVMCAKWGIASSAILAVIFAFTGGDIIHLITKSPEVQSEAIRFLPYVVAAPLFGLVAFMFDGIFLGATQTAVMRNMMAVSVIIYALSISIFVPWLGNHGLWMSLLISFLARGVTLALCYPRLEARADAGAI